MHEIASVAGKLAGIISLAAYVPYILSVLRKETKPNRASWIIWAVVSTIIALSYREAGASYAFLAPVGYVIGSTIVFILSIRHGVGGWTSFDRKCLIGAAISLVLWKFFDSPMSALLINLLINLLGTLPTARKAWYQPETESKVAWSLFSLGSIVNLFAVESWTFSMAVYPVSMIFLIGIVTVPVLWTKRPRDTSIALNWEKCPYRAEMNAEGGTVCRFGFRTFEQSAKNDLPTGGLNASDWVKKGVNLYKSGDYQKAILAFSIAIDLDVTLSAAYATRAVAYYRLGHKKQATQNLEIAARLGHKRARILLKKLTK
ncbi:MAG: tetratricopeptide repeat protein [Desulfobacterales bacterium]